MLVGQDPTIVSSRPVMTVLDLDNGQSPLRNWLETDLLIPSGIDWSAVYATNLVKCTFSDTPNRIAKKLGISMLDFLAPYIEHCSEHLGNELRCIKPTVVIALGQPVHQALVGRLRWSIPLSMREAFGEIYAVELGSHCFQYMPCPHLNTARCQPFYKARWPEMLQKLKAAVVTPLHTL